MIIRALSCFLKVSFCCFIGLLLTLAPPLATVFAHGIAGDSARTLAAFPGAVGFGHHATGGRGGEVVAVTSLADNGPGSLRAAIGVRNWSNGEVVPRTVVFRIGGTITLRSSLWIASPSLTIAGQTAPGGGIALRTTGGFDGPALGINSHNIIVQHLRIRPAEAPESACCADSLAIDGGSDIMIDHCSISWGTDEVVEIWFQSQRITIQNSIIAEGRRNHQGSVGGKGILVGDRSDQITLYRNLMAHNQQRNPLIMTRSNSVSQVVNNLIYNWRYFGSEFLGNSGPTRVNLIGNYYLSGPETRLDRYEVLVFSGARLYLRDNLGPRRPNNWLDDWTMVGTHYPNYDYPAQSILQSNREFADPPVPIISASAVQDQILSQVGATLPRRDLIDQRLIREVELGLNSTVPPPTTMEGWPVLDSAEPYPDIDLDGMDDRWELQQSLNPSDPTDNIGDLDGNGYTNLEEFLSQISASNDSSDTPTTISNPISSRPTVDSPATSNPIISSPATSRPLVDSPLIIGSPIRTN